MASTSISRTPSSTGNRQTWTFSAWVKRSQLSTDQKIFEASPDGSNTTDIRLKTDDTLQVYSEVGGVTKYNLKTNRKLRDTSAWYHVVIAVDTTQGTSSNRVKLYINGVQETSLNTATYPDQNFDTLVNYASQINVIGRRNPYSDFYFNGLISYAALVDGTQELPTIFGETDSVTGQWKIKTDITPSVAWGTNGFLILKNGNSLTDESTNTNNFTLGSGTLTNTLDCPSNVFATLNSLLTGSYASLSNGNNTLTGTSSANNAHRPATLQVGTSGKYYYEVKITANENGVGFEYPVDGVVPNSEAIQQGDGNGAAGFYPKLFFACNGRIERSNLGTGLADLTGLTVIGSTGIKMFAIDMDNGAIYIGANGAWLNNGSAIGVPSSGSSKTGAMWGFNPSDYPNIAICSSAYDAAVSNYNFGNGYFGTSAVTSAGTAGSTPGVFEYDVPSGYEPLTTKGLNA